MWTYRCLIVPDAQVAFARDLSATVAGPAGAGMWTTPLSPTGAEPVTHWISAGLIGEDFANLLPFGDNPGNAALVAELATANGMETNAEQVQILFDDSDITEEESHEAMARLGLMMVQPEVQNGD
jgi:hypothetical protein